MSALNINDYLHDGVGDILAAIFFAAVFGFLPPNYIINAAAFRNCENACLATWGNILLTCKRFKNVTTPCLQLAKTLCVNREAIVVAPCITTTPIDWRKGIPVLMENPVETINTLAKRTFFGFAKIHMGSFYKTENYVKTTQKCARSGVKHELVIRKNCDCVESHIIYGFAYCKNHAFVRYKGRNSYVLRNGCEEFRSHNSYTVNIKPQSDEVTLIEISGGGANMCDTATITYTGENCTSIHITKAGKTWALAANTPEKLTLTKHNVDELLIKVVYGRTLQIGDPRKTPGSFEIPIHAKPRIEHMLDAFGPGLVPMTYSEGKEYMNSIKETVISWKYCIPL